MTNKLKNMSSSHPFLLWYNSSHTWYDSSLYLIWFFTSFDMIFHFIFSSPKHLFGDIIFQTFLFQFPIVSQSFMHFNRAFDSTQIFVFARVSNTLPAVILFEIYIPPTHTCTFWFPSKGGFQLILNLSYLHQTILSSLSFSYHTCNLILLL